MRILQINKNFYTRGGADEVFFDTIDGLRENNHEVIEFSMVDPRNKSSAYAKYFVSGIPAQLTSRHSFTTSWKILKRLFYSTEVEKKLTRLLRDTKPEVAHIHNAYHHLSISTFLTLFRLRIPTVLTLHDYFPLCPNHNFLYNEHGAKELYQNKLYNCVRYKCIANRFAPSVVATLEAYYYRWRQVWNTIDRLICPSAFMMETLKEGGFRENSMKVIFNPFKPVTNVFPLGQKIVFLGRIHYEKGIKIFLEAVRHLKNYSVVVAGNGPEDAWVDAFISKHKLTHIERYPWVQGEKLLTVIKSARVMVFPTIAYENCSKGILEALSYGRLVVASDRGGNREMIMPNKTGFLTTAEEVVDVRKTIEKAMEVSSVQAERIISQGKQLVEEKYSFSGYISHVEKVYKEVVEK
jgi:glycosyltransferase involved in cell wall biosynthesis